MIPEFEGLTIEEDLSYQEAPLCILDAAEHTTQNKTIRFVRVQWRNHTEAEATWEREDQFRIDHPNLFS